MTSFKHFLNEMAYISLAKKAYASLSQGAKNLIDDWERSGWIGGDLEIAYKQNSELIQEINSAMIPVRKAIGSSIILYRGINTKSSPSNWQKKVLESWTDDLRVAEYFAGLRSSQGPEGRSLIRPRITDEDIRKAYDQYKKTGYLKFGSHIFKRNDKHPELKNPDYYDLYSLSRNWLTDGDNIVYSLKNDQEWIDSQNEERLKYAKVFKENVQSSRILWITNNLNSKEFIVVKK